MKGQQMRHADLQRLKRPYAERVDGAESASFRSALGIEIPATLMLRDLIFNDLDESAFGIGWWRPEPDHARRILISDYMVGCAWSIETNVIEARLHSLEALGFADEHAASMADAVKVEGRLIRLEAPGAEVRWRRAGSQFPGDAQLPASSARWAPHWIAWVGSWSARWLSRLESTERISIRP
jgi:hypothetical protein